MQRGRRPRGSSTASPAPPAYETDGEWNQARSAEVVIEAVPQALRVLVPGAMSEAGPAAASPLARAVAERALSPSDDPALDAAVRAAGRGRRATALVGPRVLRLAAHGRRAGERLERLRPVRRRRGLPGLLRARCGGPASPGSARASWRSSAAGCRPPSSRCASRPRGSTSRPRSSATTPAGARPRARRRDHFCIGRLFQPDAHPARPGRGRAAGTPGRPGLGAPRDVGLGAALAARRASTPRPTGARPSGPRCGGRCGRSPPGAPTPCGRRSGTCRSRSSRRCSRSSPAAGSSRPRRAAPGRSSPTRPVGRLERAAPRAVLPAVDRAGHRALAQAHRDLRGLARLHRPQGEPPHRRADRAHRPRAPLAPASSSGAALFRYLRTRTARGAPR